ncbi:MAG: SGNH/GDSL hydrolase family protein [Thalassotalea sp.]
MKNQLLNHSIARVITFVFLTVFTMCIATKVNAYEKVILENSVNSTSKVANKHSYLSEITDALKIKWPKNRTINIVFHGHSVPAGYFKTPIVDSFNAYPHLLHKKLKRLFPHAVINSIVTAIGGEKSDRGMERFDKDVLTHNPDILLIDYALNDRRIGLEKAKLAWQTMIIKAKKKGIKVLLLTPTGDLSAKLNDPNDPLNLHAEQIRHLAHKHEVGMVDSLAAFKAYIGVGGELSHLMSQVNHPNRKGHDLVVEQILEWFPSE